jgi:hypothetical protein
MTPGSGDKGIGQIIFLDDQRVVADSLKILRDSMKDSRVVMFDMGDLSMHWFWSVGNSSAMDPAKALVSETNSKDRDMRGLEDLCADSKVLEIATLFYE